MKKVTMQTIADDLGISKVSVHKALKTESGVGQTLKQKILKRASELGYIPKNQDSSSNIHFLYIVDKKYFLSEEQFYTKIFYYLNLDFQVDQGKVDLIVYDDTTTFIHRIKKLLPISGIFLAGETDHLFMKQLESLNVPVISIDFISNNYDFDFIYINNYHSSVVATQYLLDNGHKNIGLICDIYSANSNTDRYFGYLKALTINRLQFNDKWLINKNIEQTGIDSFELPDELPTAYVCHCDKAAQQLYLKLKMTTNSQVGHDISIISFDNTEICDKLEPKLTSVGITSEQIAHTAFELAQTRLQNPQGDKVKLSLYPNISVRDSVKPVKNLRTT